MRPAFKPAPGRIAVVREAVMEALSVVEREDGTKVEIVGADGDMYSTDVQYRKAINPWALVVGVGEPRRTDYGTTIETDVQEGDKVLISEVGRSVPLETADGEKDYVYVLPFEGILGVLEWACDKPGCGYRARREPQDGLCLKCPRIETATAADVLRMR